MHVTACLAGQEDVDVEVGEDCRTLQALKEAVVKALPQLCVEGFDVSVGGRALDDDEGVVSLVEGEISVRASTRFPRTSALRPMTKATDHRDVTLLFRGVAEPHPPDKATAQPTMARWLRDEMPLLTGGNDGGEKSAELKALRSFLKEHGLDAQSSAGGGNCQSMALSYAIHGDQAAARDLRRMSAAWVREHEEIVKPMLIGGHSVEDHASLLAKEGVWGDHVALRGLAEVTRRTVEVFYMKGEEVAVRTIKPLATEAGTVARVIWLKKGHFAAIKGEQTSDPAAAAAEDESDLPLCCKPAMETKSKKTKEVKGGRSALPKGARLRPADWDVPVTGWCEDVPAVAGVCLVPEEKEEQAAVRAIDHEWKDTTFVTARRLATKNAKAQQVLMELVDTEGKTVGGKVVTCYVTGPAETRGLAKEIAAAAKPRPLVHSARLFMLTPVKEGDSEKDPERMRKVRKWTEQHLKAKVELFPGKVRNGAETFPVVVPPSAVLTALRMSGIEGVFVRTAAAEEDELKVVWLPGASLAEARSMTRLLDTKAVGTTWDPTNKRYGVRAHEDDMTMVTCAVQAQGYGTKTAAPLYVLSGMPSQLNKLDVEGTIATLTREGWAASVVRRIGGKFRTTWLVTAVEPPPVWAFAVPNGVATFAAYNKPEPKQEKKQQASWKLTDWGRPPARPTEDEMADDEAGAETAEGVVTLAQRLRAELGDLRQREEAEKAAKSAVAKKTAAEVRKKKEEELAVKAAKLQTAEQELRSRAEHEREKEASRAGEAQEIKDLFQAQAALHAEQMAAMERQMASQSDFIRQLQATIDRQAEAQQAAQLQLNVQQSQQNRLQLEVQSQAQQPAAPAQADPNAAPVWFQAAMAAQKTEITRSVETSAQLSLGEVRESLKQASTLAQKTTKEISAIAARLSAVEKNPLLTMSRSQDTGAGKGGKKK